MRIGPIRTISWSAVATAAALLFSGSVLAHSGEILLVAEPTTVAPGETVTVRADLPTTGPLRLSLAGSDGSVREVGVVEETAEGHFEVAIQVPVDLPPGRWALVAQADGAPIASTTLEVAGSPVGTARGDAGSSRQPAGDRGSGAVRRVGRRAPRGRDPREPGQARSFIGRAIRPAAVTPGTETVRMGGATAQRTALSAYWASGRWR